MIKLIASVIAALLVIWALDGDYRPVDPAYLTISYYCLFTLMDIERETKGKGK